MISDTGLVLDVVVTAPPGRSRDLERAVRRLRADLDRRFPRRETRITIACDADTAEAAERLSGRLPGVRAVRLEASERHAGLRTARLGLETGLVVSAEDSFVTAAAGSRSPPS